MSVKSFVQNLLFEQIEIESERVIVGQSETFGFADTDLAAGIYFAVIRSGDIRTVRKVIIQ